MIRLWREKGVQQPVAGGGTFNTKPEEAQKIEELHKDLGRIGARMCRMLIGCSLAGSEGALTVWKEEIGKYDAPQIGTYPTSARWIYTNHIATQELEAQSHVHPSCVLEKSNCHSSSLIPVVLGRICPPNESSRDVDLAGIVLFSTYVLVTFSRLLHESCHWRRRSLRIHGMRSPPSERRSQSRSSSSRGGHCQWRFRVCGCLAIGHHPYQNNYRLSLLQKRNFRMNKNRDVRNLFRYFLFRINLNRNWAKSLAGIFCFYRFRFSTNASFCVNAWIGAPPATDCDLADTIPDEKRESNMKE